MINELVKHLSKNDLVELLELSYRSLSCKEESHLKTLVLDLKRLIYFEHTVCANGNLVNFLERGVQAPKIDVWDISYPPGYLDVYVQEQHYNSDALLCEFVTTLSPVNWNNAGKKHGYDYPSSILSLECNMNDGWVHGALDRASMNCCVFYFSGPYAENTSRAYKILTHIVPYLSEAYKRLQVKTAKSITCLTEKEKEILNWMKEGKSSWEISVIQSCSKRTVDFHINNIKYKLNAVSRAQAVAIGMHLGFISF